MTTDGGSTDVEAKNDTSRDGRHRSSIKPGQHVSIVLKRDQQTGALTEGIVERLLTNSAFHPHGIKVKLSSGEVGRVKEIHD